MQKNKYALHLYKKNCRKVFDLTAAYHTCKLVICKNILHHSTSNYHCTSKAS